MIRIESNRRTITFDRYHEPSLLDDKTVTAYKVTYRHPKATMTNRKKAFIAGMVTIAVWIGYNLLVMTDIEDTKPTVTLYRSR